jgi:methionine-rich copper-binding protein CopC
VRTLILLALTAVALAGLALPASRAGAHADYDRSEPADGAVLAESPSRVDAWFGQDMRRSEGLPVMIVVNDAGDTLNPDGAVLDDADRTHLTAELPPALPDGRYTVIWHTLSDEDGEEAQGAFHFYVGAGPTDATPTPSETRTPAESPTPPPPGPTPTAATPPDGGGDDDGSELPLWTLFVGIAGGMAAGSVGAFALARRTQEGGRPDES